MKFLIISSLIFLSLGCASNQLDRFDKIRAGMDKDGVLEAIGNPLRTEKSHNQEKWSYRYFTGEDKQTELLKYVSFINGRVTTFGEDVEEEKRLAKLKDAAIKNNALREKKAEVDEKVEKAYEDQKNKKPSDDDDSSEN